MAKPVFVTNDVPTAAQFNDWLVNIGYARRTSTATITSSTTLVADSQLTLPVAVNAEYELYLWLSYDGATGGDLKAQLDMPAGATYSGHLHALVSTAASQQDYQGFVWTGTATAIGCLGGTASAWTKGILITGGTSGSVTLSWAQNTSSGTSTRIFVPSYLSLVRRS